MILSGLIFLDFFTERFFAHVGRLAVGAVDGEVGFLPLRFYCKEMNIGARDLLQFRLPTLEKLLRDKLVCKVVEHREEFRLTLRYLSWEALGVFPLLDLLAVLDTVGSSVGL